MVKRVAKSDTSIEMIMKVPPQVIPLLIQSHFGSFQSADNLVDGLTKAAEEAGHHHCHHNCHRHRYRRLNCHHHHVCQSSSSPVPTSYGT